MDSFNLLEDDGTSNDYLKGKFASTIMELTNKGRGFVVTINPIAGKLQKYEQKQEMGITYYPLPGKTEAGKPE